MKIHRGLCLLSLLWLCAPLAAAQDDSGSRFEVFGGFSYLMTDLDEQDAPLDRFDNLDGFNVSVTRYLTKRFGITGDFSAHFRKTTEEFPGGTVRFKSRSYGYFAGPQVKFRNRTRATPFVHALAGAANNRFTVEAVPAGATTPVRESIKLTDFALVLGGGLDVRITKRIELRVFQVEYNPVFVRSRTLDLGEIESRRLDNMRFSIGIVFK
jgi:opacity protein-like surface antigen